MVLIQVYKYTYILCIYKSLCYYVYIFEIHLLVINIICTKEYRYIITKSIEKQIVLNF